MDEKTRGGIKAVNLRIQELRVARGLTQAQMAEKLDVTLRAYQYWESGEKDMRVSTLINLAQALSCHPSKFFDKPKSHPLSPGRPAKVKSKKS
jgi:transcriptional regulator with XRE-family HTH domain